LAEIFPLGGVCPLRAQSPLVADELGAGFGLEVGVDVAVDCD